VAIFGKTWDLHVKKALRISLDENLLLIADSVAYLKKKGKEVIYDAEHFFDGYKDNPEYAIKTLVAAAESGADTLCLCDTNGGNLPMKIEEIIKIVMKEIPGANIGIHAHNDSGVAVANSLIAVQTGANHVQGTTNGIGERCGNADLIQVIPALVLKMNKKALPKKNLKQLTEVSNLVFEAANLIPDTRKPYVGRAAFTHKGGIHVSAVARAPETYEHLQPELVGNRRDVVISDLSGMSNIVYKAKEFGVDLSKAEDKALRNMVNQIKIMENEGFEFESADGSFVLMLRKALKETRKFFELAGFRVIIEKRGPEEECLSEATIKINVDGEDFHTAAEGDGPVNALDSAVRKALLSKYPALQDMHLTDFKVRVINPKEGTAAKVRVFIESTDGARQWTTVGVSENIIEASWQALCDSIQFALLERTKKKQGSTRATSKKKTRKPAKKKK
jgi:2-isopropylmalate synthase